MGFFVPFVRRAETFREGAWQRPSFRTGREVSPSLAMAVNPDHRVVDHGIFHVSIIRDSLENLLENPRILFSRCSAGKPSSSARNTSVVPPWTACKGYPQDSLNEESVILPVAPAIRLLSRAQRFYLRPPGTRQYKAIHTGFEAHPETLKKASSQQVLILFI